MEQATGSGPYDKALRLREALEGRPEAGRTRGDYARVLDAFRAVYHGDPRDRHADASVDAVAGLLAEEGRLFEDHKASLDAIAEYEFLRRAYPGSPRRESALFTEGEIYSRDLRDEANARGVFAGFLRQYGRSPLAAEARRALAGPAATHAPVGAGRRSTVLAAALASQAPPPVASATRSSPARSAPAAPVAAGASGNPALGGAGSASGGTGLVERDLPSEPPPPPPSSPSSVSPVAASPRTGGTLLPADAAATPPPPRRGRLPLVTGVRHWSTSVYTRVAIDLQDEVQYEASRAPNPDRIFFDLHGARLSPELAGRAVEVTDGGYLKRIRAAQFTGDVVRVVLDVNHVSEYSAFFLPNPSRLIIDIHGAANGPVNGAGNSVANGSLPSAAAVGTSPPQVLPRRADPSPAPQAAPSAARSGSHAVRGSTASQGQADALREVARLDQQPNTVKATLQPTTAPVSAHVPNTQPATQPGMQAAAPPGLPPAAQPDSHSTTPSAALPSASVGRSRTRGTPAQTLAPPIHAVAPTAGEAIRAAAPTAAGERSMVRALGLKIGRIVIDAGHGGHDSGTLGPGGIEEKDVVLDVALRLGRLLKQRLGADVIYTRDDDTFIPLETRTAIANRAQADLFLSVHANSSPDASARGVETYYLNFTTSADALEVAARENAVSDQSIHQLSDLVKKITLQDKIAESREFAGDVEATLYGGLETGNPGLRDRGVKKAPFVVLIGANMPSILAEISFLTNPDDARQLRDPEYKQRIAEALYRGVAKYVSSLSGVRLAQGAAGPQGQ